MIADNKITQYNALLEPRLILGKEIEQISYVLLSINLSTNTKNTLLKELEDKTQQYNYLVNQIGNFKFE